MNSLQISWTEITIVKYYEQFILSVEIEFYLI